MAGPVTEIAADPIYLDVSVPAHAQLRVPRHALATRRWHTSSRARARWAASVVRGPKLLLFGDGDAVEVRTGEQAVRFLLMSGQPANEPIFRYGPFVMNTREEILQALRDLQEGTFVRR